MVIKKTIVFCVIVSACLTSIINAQTCQVLRVGGTNNWLPIAYTNKETQEPEGIAHDFARLIGEELDIPVELNATLPWKRMLAYLDMTVALFRTQEREVLYQFTSPYFKSEEQVFVVKGKEFSYEKYEDLIGHVDFAFLKVTEHPFPWQCGIKFDQNIQSFPDNLGKIVGNPFKFSCILVEHRNRWPILCSSNPQYLTCLRIDDRCQTG